MRRGTTMRAGNRFDPLKSRVGTFLPSDVVNIYQYDSQEEYRIEVKKNNNNTLTVDKILFLGKTKIHCLRTITLDSQRQFDRLVVFANEANLYYAGDTEPTVFYLPVTTNSLENFEKLGGLIKLDENVDKKLTLKQYGKNFTAVENKITEGDDGIGVTFENEIDALFEYMILFKDGTLKIFPQTFYRFYHDTKVVERDKSRTQFYREIDAIDEKKMTDDGCNVKKLFNDIDLYIKGNFTVYKQKECYDALTNILIQYKTDPSKQDVISHHIEKIQGSLQTGKDLAIGILCLLGAAALLGIAAGFFVLSCLSILLIPVGAVISALFIDAGAILGTFAVLNLHTVRKGFEYDKNISKLTQFFQSPKQDVAQLDSSLQLVDVVPNTAGNGDNEQRSPVILEEQKCEKSPEKVEEELDEMEIGTFTYDMNGSVVECY